MPVLPRVCTCKISIARLLRFRNYFRIEPERLEKITVCADFALYNSNSTPHNISLTRITRHITVKFCKRLPTLNNRFIQQCLTTIQMMICSGLISRFCPANIVARSITFLTSRTFPGQLCCCKTDMASGDITTLCGQNLEIKL